LKRVRVRPRADRDIDSATGRFLDENPAAAAQAIAALAIPQMKPKQTPR